MKTFDIQVQFKVEAASLTDAADNVLESLKTHAAEIASLNICETWCKTAASIANSYSVPLTPETEPAKVRIMAKARAVAEEHDIDWAALSPGRGKNGMITQDDVRDAIKVKCANAEPRPDPAPSVSFGDLRERMSLYVQEHGKDKAREFLGEYNVDRISALPEDKYEAAYSALGEQLG